jgi:outer membrane protein, multidrug efflux system
VRSNLSIGFLFLGLLILVGCSVGPPYIPPEANQTPDAFSWKEAEPQDDIPKGQWWTLFNDPVLNTLEEKATANNPNLMAVVASIDMARAQLDYAYGASLPSITLNANAERLKTSANQPFSALGVGTGFGLQSITTYEYTLALSLNYEIDLWGQIRYGIQQQKASYESTLANYQNALLTLQATLANQYFLLRVTDLKTEILEKELKLREQNLNLVNIRHEAGFVSELDVTQARTLKASAESLLVDSTRQRLLLEHGIATLCAIPASSFAIEPTPIMAANPLIVPAGLPSSLLERRPDVAQAERNAAAASASLGIAYTAFYPNISLTGQFGYLSTQANNLFTKPSQIWFFGPTLSLPIFQGGQLVANLKGAKATYAQTLLNYQGVVLQAFQDVEDALANLHLKAKQFVYQQEAITSSRRATTLSTLRYENGLVAFLEVMDSSRTELENELQGIAILGERYTASVALIKALGGGWEKSDLLIDIPPSVFESPSNETPIVNKVASKISLSPSDTDLQTTP